MQKALCLVMILAVPLGARGADRPAERRAFPGNWRILVYQLPGGYRFLDRLELKEQQTKVLGEIHREWMAEWRKAQAAALKEQGEALNKLYRDLKTRPTYYAALKKLYKDVQPPAPLDSVKGILTIPQLDKVEAANKVVVGWNKWFDRTMGDYEKRLAKAVGPTPEKLTRMERYEYGSYGRYVRGGELFPRLGLTDAQRAALKEAVRGTRVTPVVPRLAFRHLFWFGEASAAGVVRSAVSGGSMERRNELVRERIEKVLTDDHRGKLARAVRILAERDNLIAERYQQSVAQLSRILPIPKPTAWKRPEPPDELRDYPKAKEAIAAWRAWVDENLPKYEKRLGEVLGPAPKEARWTARYRYSAFEKYLKGASLLGRLKLTDEQEAALKDFRPWSRGSSTVDRVTLARWLSAGQVPADRAAALKGALAAARSKRRGRAIREQLMALLTAEQRAKLARAVDIVEERDRAIRERYTRCVLALQKLLPARKPAPPARKAPGRQ